MEEKVSVVITAFGRRDYLSEALESIKNQRDSSFLLEIIVVKNFLDEAIDNLIKSIGGNSILASNAPLCNYVYLGIKASTGKFILFLEDDDIFLDDKISNAIKIMQRYDLSFYHNAYQATNKGLDSISSVFYRNPIKPIFVRGRVAAKTSVRRMLKYNGDLNLSSMCISRKLVLDNLDKIEVLKHLSAGPDWFMFLLALNDASNMYLDSIVYSYYRIHDSTVNSTSRDWTMLSEKRINLLRRELESLGSMKDTFQSRLVRWILDFRMATDLLQLQILGFSVSDSKERTRLSSIVRVRKDLYGVGILLLLMLKKLFPEKARMLYLHIFQEATFGAPLK